MLVLSRQRDERIYAGPVVIQVVAIRGDKVRLGIEAPRAIAVHRQEVLESIYAEDPGALNRLGYKVTKSGLIMPVLVED